MYRIKGKQYIVNFNLHIFAWCASMRRAHLPQLLATIIVATTREHVEQTRNGLLCKMCQESAIGTHVPISHSLHMLTRNRSLPA